MKQPNSEELAYIMEWTPKCKGNIPLFAEKMLGINLHAGQIRLAKEMEKKFYPVNLALIPNRWGKSVFVAVKHIYKNFYKECGPGMELNPADWPYLDYQTINTAPSSENTKIMLKIVLSIMRSNFSIRSGNRLVKNHCRIQYFVDLDGLANYGDKVPDQGPFEIRFANKSKFRAFTLGATHGDTIQGDKYGYASYDEFGRSKNPEKEIEDIVPRMTDYNGELDIITTPDMENELTVSYLMEKSEMAKEVDSEWRFFSGSYEENDYIPTEEREKRLSGMSEDKKRQILYGEIRLAGAKYFDVEAATRAFNNNLMPDRPAEPGRKYSIGLDTAGNGQDYWAVSVWDITEKPFTRVYYYYDNRNQPEVNIGITKNILDRFRKASHEVWFVMDCSNEAGSIYAGDFAEYSPQKYRFGIMKGTKKNSKNELLDTFRRGLNADLLKIPYEKMLKNQIISYKGPQEDEHQVTDALMSAALGVYNQLKEHFDSLGEMVIDV